MEISKVHTSSQFVIHSDKSFRAHVCPQIPVQKYAATHFVLILMETAALTRRWGTWVTQHTSTIVPQQPSRTSLRALSWRRRWTPATPLSRRRRGTFRPNRRGRRRARFLARGIRREAGSSRAAPAQSSHVTRRVSRVRRATAWTSPASACP